MGGRKLPRGAFCFFGIGLQVADGGRKRFGVGGGGHDGGERF